MSKLTIEKKHRLLVNAVKDSNFGTSEITKLMGRISYETRQQTGETGMALVSLMTNDIQTVIQSSHVLSRNLIKNVKALTVGILLSMGAHGDNALKAIRLLSKNVIYITAKLGANEEEVSYGLIQGMAESAPYLDNLESAQAISECTSSIMSASYDISPVMGDELRESLSGNVAGFNITFR